MYNLHGLPVLKNVNLSPYLTFRTNARARYFFAAESQKDLINAKKASLQTDVPLFILGGGSNLVILKDFLEFLVVKNNYMEKKVVEENNQYALLQVSSGYSVTRLAKETAEAGLEGVEYHLGLPGTVGGAVYMNSKWTHPTSYFGDSLVSALILDKNGNVKKVDRNYFHFAYDSSILQKTKEIVLEVTLKLKKASSDVLIKRNKDVMDYRKRTQPFGIFSSGCFFRNIGEYDQKRLNLPTASAGYLVDKAGLKGVHSGNFIVSDKHANFIIHKGDGDPQDLKKLLQRIKERVKEKFGVELKEEVIVI